MSKLITQKFVVIFACLIVLGILYWLLRPSVEVATNRPVSVPTLTVPRLPSNSLQSYPEPPKSSNLALAHSKEEFLSLRLEYQQTKNLATFIQKALGLNHPIGPYYAMETYIFCNSIQIEHANAAHASKESVTPSTSNKVALMAGLELEIERCNPMFAQYPDLRTFVAIVNDANKKFPQSFDAFQSDKSMDRYKTMLNDALKLGDPNLLSSIGVRMLGGPNTKATWLGAPMDELQRDAVLIAWTVIRCDLGADCANNPAILTLCTGIGQCDVKNIDEALKLIYPPELLAKINEARAVILAAISGGYVSSLLGSG